MQVAHVAGEMPQDQDPIVLAIGKFDGVHIGHQAILRAASASSEAAQMAVMSFWPHPAWVLQQKDGYDRMLTPFEEKCRLLTTHGVKKLYQVEFSREFANTTAEDFVRSFLGRLNLKRVVVGSDFRFGRGGKADVVYLEQLCGERGIPITQVQPVEENGVKVSSSQIRAHLQNGRVEAAEALLGRPYAVIGTVVHGDARGRLLGFPTANLGDLETYVMPQGGVYAVSVEIVGDVNTPRQNWFGVLNAGFRPTVNGRDFRMEVHLLGFDGDLYGKTLRVSFLRRIRDERKFSGVDELSAQIKRDVSMVEQMLGMGVRGATES